MEWGRYGYLPISVRFRISTFLSVVPIVFFFMGFRHTLAEILGSLLELLLKAFSEMLGRTETQAVRNLTDIQIEILSKHLCRRVQAQGLYEICGRFPRNPC